VTLRDDKKRRTSTPFLTPYGRIGLIFFLYAACVALLIQFVVLPYMFPELHHGQGLMSRGDWNRHHQLAVELAEKIRTQGWGAWQLRPESQAPAGIAGAIYALTVSEPWTLIPLNAALHALAVLALLRIIQFFLPDWRRALWAALPFLVYPTAMLWYTQLLKDSYSITGFMLFVLGWLFLCGLRNRQNSVSHVIKAIGLVLAGAFLIWIVRPYMLQMLQAISAALALILSGMLIYKAVKSSLTWASALLTIALSWTMVVGITPLELPGNLGNGKLFAVELPTEEEIPKIDWQSSAWLPAFIEKKVYNLAVAREGFIHSYPDAGSNIDNDVIFQNTWDVIAYVPRAIFIALFEPLPNVWLGQGNYPSTSVMRRMISFEMVGIYLALLGLPMMLWTWRKHFELWVVLAFCGGMMVIYTLAIPNLGTLHRMRYGFLMTLVALGICGFITVILQHRQKQT